MDMTIEMMDSGKKGSFKMLWHIAKTPSEEPENIK